MDVAQTIKEEQLNKLEILNFELFEQLMDLQFQINEAKIQKSVLESKLGEIQQSTSHKLRKSLSIEDTKLIQRFNQLCRLQQDLIHQNSFERELIEEKKADIEFLNLELRELPSLEQMQATVQELQEDLEKKKRDLEDEEMNVTGLKAKEQSYAEKKDHTIFLSKNLDKPPPGWNKEKENLITQLNVLQSNIESENKSIEQIKKEIEEYSDSSCFSVGLRSSLIIELSMLNALMNDLQRAIKTEEQISKDLDREILKLQEAQTYTNNYQSKVQKRKLIQLQFTQKP